jgi:hypothetical protein
MLDLRLNKWSKNSLQLNDIVSWVQGVDFFTNMGYAFRSWNMQQSLEKSNNTQRKETSENLPQIDDMSLN